MKISLSISINQALISLCSSLTLLSLSIFHWVFFYLYLFSFFVFVKFCEIKEHFVGYGLSASSGLLEPITELVVDVVETGKKYFELIVQGHCSLFKSLFIGQGHCSLLKSFIFTYLASCSLYISLFFIVQTLCSPFTVLVHSPSSLFIFNIHSEMLCSKSLFNVQPYYSNTGTKKPRPHSDTIK